MANTVQTVKAALRERAGKGNARQTRRDGNIPAVIYGGKEAPIMIALGEREFSPLMRRSGFFTHLVDIEADGKVVRAIPRDVQYDPVSDQPVHVDFLRVSANTRIRVNVPVVFINQDKSPGLKRGGVLNIVQHELQLICSPEKIPEKVEINVDGLNIGDTIHVESIQLPADVKPVLSNKSDSTIASIAAPTTVKEETTTTAATDATAAAAPGAAPAAGAAAAAPAAGGKAAAPAAAAAAKAPAAKK